MMIILFNEVDNEFFLKYVDGWNEKLLYISLNKRAIVKLSKDKIKSFKEVSDIKVIETFFIGESSLKEYILSINYIEDLIAKNSFNTEIENSFQNLKKRISKEIMIKDGLFIIDNFVGEIEDIKYIYKKDNIVFINNGILEIELFGDQNNNFDIIKELYLEYKNNNIKDNKI